MDLWDFQDRTVKQVLHHFDVDGHRGVFMQGPCGVGKTVTFTRIIKILLGRKMRGVVVAHRRTLISQASQELLNEQIPFGVIRRGPSTNPSADVQVASIDSMRNRELPWEPDFIVVDEAHLAKANRYTDFFARYPNALLLLVSATPVRLDGSGFDDLAQSLVIMGKISEFVHHPDGPFLVPGIMFQGSDLGKVDERLGKIGGDFKQKERERLMCSERLVGDVVEGYIKRAYGLKGIVFSSGLTHSRLLAEQFNAAGIIADYIDSTMDDDEIDHNMKRHARGESKILINFNMLAEGYNDKSIEYLGDACPTNSLAWCLQKWGRVMRVSPKTGKKKGVILDHGMNSEIHGHVMDDRAWDLQGLNTDEQLRTPTIYCGKCRAAMPKRAYVCPNCEHKQVFINGHTVALKNDVSTPVKVCPILHKYRLLVRWEIDKGKKPGWAYFRLVEQFGHSEVARKLSRRDAERIQKEEGMIR